MKDPLQTHQRWLEEKFSHVNTVLDHIRKSVDDVKSSQEKCMTNCNSQLNSLHLRLLAAETRQAETRGAQDFVRDVKQSANVTWQMVIALGTALSGLAAFVGYFLGKG
jgi:hypothetical protein